MADPSDPDPLPGLPPADIRRLIDEQNTDELKTRAVRFAEAWVPRVRNAGRPVSKNHATELVDDAIADTWLGVVTWTPTRCDFLVHICGVIKDRTSYEIRRARKFPHLSLDVAANDPDYDARIEPALASASFGDCAPILIMGLTARVADELRRLAADDPDAQAILGCWANGFVERWEVMAITGLSKEAFKAARKRLLSLKDDLPSELRETARELFRRVS